MIDREMLKGSVDLLLLSLIRQQDLYGYEMVQRIKRMSDDAYDMSEGTLYAALKRMERSGWITSYWEQATSGRRKYYTITNQGIKEWKRKQDSWHSLHQLIQKSSEGLT